MQIKLPVPCVGTVGANGGSVRKDEITGVGFGNCNVKKLDARSISKFFEWIEFKHKSDVWCLKRDDGLKVTSQIGRIKSPNGVYVCANRIGSTDEHSPTQGAFDHCSMR